MISRLMKIIAIKCSSSDTFSLAFIVQ